MSFEARNALMLAKKVADKAAEYKKVAEKADGGEVKQQQNEFEPKEIGKDAVGRPIYDWKNSVVSHFTDPESAEDIEKRGYKVVGQGYYGDAISFTNNRDYGRQFGGVETRAHISPKARILNLNDPDHWDVFKKITGNAGLDQFKSIMDRNKIDGVYDAGAGDLFVFNPKIVKHLRSEQVKKSSQKADGGEVDDYARGGDVMHTRKVPKPHTPVVGEKQHKPHHPTMMIPGIHVVEPVHGISILQKHEEGGRVGYEDGGNVRLGDLPAMARAEAARPSAMASTPSQTVNAFTRGATEYGGGSGRDSSVAFPGASGGGGGQDAVRQQMEFAFPTKMSGFGGAPSIGMPQSLKELQGFKPQAEQQEAGQPDDLFAKTIKQATFLPSVGTTTFDQTVGGLPSGSFGPDLSKYSMINPASAPKADLMSLSGIDPATGAKVIAGMQGTQPDRPFGSAAQLMQSAASQQQPIATSPDTSDIFASYFQEPSKQPVQVAQAQQPSPSVDYNVKFDPVTQGFVRTSEPQQPGPITQIAMAAPPARPITPTPSTAYQPAPLAQAAGTPTMGYEPPTQLAQAATGLTYTPQVNASFTPPARPITITPQAQPQQLAQAATGLTYTPTAAAVPMPMPRPTEVAAVSTTTPSVSEQDALVLPGRKTFQLPTNAPLPTPRPSDLPQSNIISDIIDPVMAQMAFAEGQRINDLEAMGKTATYPGYSTPSDPEAAARQYAQAIGLNPNNPADMAKVKARIIQQDGQDRVDYYTKTLAEAIFGTGQPQTQGQISQPQATTSDRIGTRRRLVKKLMPDGTYQDVYEEYATGGKVKSYPLAKAGKKKLSRMKPEEFLKRARPLPKAKEDRRIIDGFKQDMKKGKALDPLALYEGGKENGRHRATAAKELGIKKVPVHDYRKRDGGAIVKHALMVISKKA